MKRIIFIISILLFINLIAAQAVRDVQLNTEDLGLDISYPKYTTLQQGQFFNFHIHVFNKTNGVMMKYPQVSCLIHLYNQTGNHIIEAPMEWDSNNVDFYLKIMGNNFTKIGVYPIIVQCNTSTLGGFDSYALDVTNSGYTENGDIFNTMIYLLFIVACIGLFYTFFLGLAKLATSEMTVYDVIVSLAFYILMIIVNHLGGTYLMFGYVEDLSATLLTLTVWTNGVLPIISFIISIFVKSTKKKKNLSINELAGRRFY